MAKYYIIPILICVFFISSCGKKSEPRFVDMDQVEVDGSTDDRYEFKEEIEKEKKRKRRYKKEEF